MSEKKPPESERCTYFFFVDLAETLLALLVVQLGDDGLAAADIRRCTSLNIVKCSLQK
jgi:hypothetical protein